MTPSLPTFSMASAIRLPISLSLFAEIVPTWAISFLPAEGTDKVLSCSTTASTARSMPRFSSMGLAPAVTFLSPSRKIAWASTVAVVVPSPARSDVLVATSLTICAPIFSIGSLSSTSLATVTPSLVTVGDPNFLSMTTFLPLGPRVTFTASASWSTPRLSLDRASVLKRSSLDAMSQNLLMSRAEPAALYSARLGLADLGQNVRGLDDDDFVAAELERGATVLTVDHDIANLQIHRDAIALFHSTGPNRDHFALSWLFLGR